MKIKVTVEGYAKYDLSHYVPEGAVIKSYSIEHDDITIHYTLNGHGYQCCRSLNLLSHTEDHIHTQIEEIKDDNDVEEEEDNVIEGANYRHGDDPIVPNWFNPKNTHKRYNTAGIEGANERHEDDPLVEEGWTEHSDGTYRRYSMKFIDLTKPKGHGR